MGQGKRDRLSTEQRIDMWRRWKSGESLHEIGRAFGKGHGSIRFLLTQRGGIIPAAHRRSLQTLTLAEREDISRGIASGLSIREIANGLQRAVSTVSREVARHGGRPLYRANEADQQAWESALRPKVCLLAIDEKLRTIVASKLILDWSPEQVSKWLKVHYPSNESMRVSHETIYRSLFVQARGVLKKELIEHLRLQHPIRRSRHATAKADHRGRIPDTVSIRERPAEAKDRAVPGHWEGDLICGSANSYLVTLVERQTRYLMIAKVANRDTYSVVTALIKQAKRLPEELYRSLTWDRGTEMTDHKRFTLATDVAVYFCDPQSPWQRGSNENTNRLLRQYLPKRTDLAVHSQARLNKIARQLNERPRKTLHYETPAERFQACVASTS